jgi:hypothetical protein
VRVIWHRGVARGEVRADIDSEIVLDLIYGPIIYRLLVGHAPLNAKEAKTLVSAVFVGIQRSSNLAVSSSQR